MQCNAVLERGLIITVCNPIGWRAMTMLSSSVRTMVSKHGANGVTGRPCQHERSSGKSAPTEQVGPQLRADALHLFNSNVEIAQRQRPALRNVTISDFSPLPLSGERSLTLHISLQDHTFTPRRHRPDPRLTGNCAYEQR